jgi:hypothetical protein
VGGAVESMVKLAKLALERTLENKQVEDLNLLTMLALAEEMLNRRPLGRISPDTEDEEVLTAQHFLTGKSLGRSNAFAVTNTKDKFVTKWLRLHRRVESMWQRLIDEVLPEVSLKNK